MKFFLKKNLGYFSFDKNVIFIFVFCKI